MASKISATERILNLIAYLFKNSNRYVTRDDIFSQVEGYLDEPVTDALLRLFERDKKKLRETGISLFTHTSFIGDKTQASYQIDMSQSLLPPLTFTAEERILLDSLTQIHPPQTAVGYYLRLALIKIRSEYDNSEFDELEKKAVVIQNDSGYVKSKNPPIYSQKIETTHEGPLIKDLLNAASLRKWVKFSYQRPQGSSENREVAPYGLFYLNRFWYLVGFSKERDSIRIFKLERISSRINTSEKTFVPVEKAEIEAVVKKLHQMEFGMSNAEFLFKPELSFMAEEEYGSIGDFKMNSDGSATLKLENALKSTIWRILSDYQEFVELVGPDNTKQEIKNEIEEIINSYENK